MYRVRSLVLLISMVGAACGSLGEPYLGSFPTSSVPEQGDNGADDGGSDATGATLPGQVAFEALPPRPADYVPSIIVLTTDRVGVIAQIPGPDRFSEFRPLILLEEAEDDGEPTTTAVSTTTVDDDGAGGPTTTATTEPTEPSSRWIRARDDLFGGLVLQAVTGEIRWFPGTGGGVRAVEAEGNFVEVGYSAGTPEVLTERAGQIIRTRLIDNESTVLTSLEPGQELIDLSSSGGIVAIATRDEACGSVDFVAGDGTPLTINPFGPLVCFESARPTVGAVAMSPDGEAVLFTVVQYRSDGVELETELFAVELTTGADILAQPVGGSGEVVTSLAFDGSTAVALRRSSAGNEVVVVDAESVEVIDLEGVGVPRAVTIARLPLSENFGQ
ncbi:MAG: hypothetical protein HKN24_14875 [Acidimicrobiales bacterium]|nr:hypothetical protein [Acidimicrobiales bacterium]